MNLDQMTIAVRRRTLAELYDLALLVLRRHLLPLTTLAVLGALPWVLLDRWLLDGLNDPALAWYFLAVLALAQAPLATAAMTAYLGEAMFNPQPKAARAMATAWQHIGFLLQIALMYGVLAWLPPLLFMAPPHAVAVAVLENQGGSPAWKRAHALRAAWATAWPSHLMMGAGIVVVTLVMLVGTLNALMQVLTSAKAMPDWEELLPRLDPSQSVLPCVAFFGALAYLSIVHFLAYLDLRTSREGWDIDLALRRVADRLQEAP